MDKAHPQLPIFHFTTRAGTGFYLPGHVAVASKAQARAMLNDWVAGRPGHSALAKELEQRARRALADWGAEMAKPFTPRCLTVNLSNRCQLACGYCYVRRDGLSDQRRVVSREAVLQAARPVAQSCASQGLPFTLVLHGGGEPTLHFTRLREIVADTRWVAREMGLEWWCYLATNGQLTADQVAWLAANVNLIGLSCDGPPDLHDRQRPVAKGGGSSARVEATARLLAHSGAAWRMRATLTPWGLERQVEIVRYLVAELGAAQISLEPIYQGRLGEMPAFSPADAPVFLENFLAAQQEAARLGASLDFSGVRLNELHGPFCNKLRGVVHLLPDGSTTACPFHRLGATYLPPPEPGLGEPPSVMHRAVLELPAACRACAAALHCARQCPDICLFDSAPAPGSAAGQAAEFRCRVQRALAEAWIRQAAAQAPGPAAGHSPRAAGARSSAPDAQERALDDWLRQCPSSIDAQAIREQWRAVAGTCRIGERQLPPPLWAERGYDQRGRAAWPEVARQARRSRPGKPLSVYIHIPFCDRRCRFCDCYSFVVNHGRPWLLNRLVEALLVQMEQWAGLGPLSRRPVTTVHLGGGTPTCLGLGRLERLLDGLRRWFNLGPQCELALEATSSHLTPEMLQGLRSMGFSRLHLGVQTLDDQLRSRIGRRESNQEVLAAVTRALDDGWVLSVDMIYGFPGQTPHALVSDLERLDRLGVHGFSLYELQLSAKNRRALARQGLHGVDSLTSYLLFQCGDQLLSRAGLAKNYFSHFARPADTNLYYTFAERGEDLLAWGPSADGVIGSYHYRQGNLKTFALGQLEVGALLEGGVSRELRWLSSYRLLTQLLAGKPVRGSFVRAGLAGLWQNWQDMGLLAPGSAPSRSALSANGSWFVHNMMEQTKAAFLENVV